MDAGKADTIAQKPQLSCLLPKPGQPEALPGLGDPLQQQQHHPRGTEGAQRALEMQPLFSKDRLQLP